MPPQRLELGILEDEEKKLQGETQISLKPPQFLSFVYETWWKYSSHELIIFIKLHEKRTKSVDFLLLVNF